MSDEITELKEDRDNWRRVACYLAECHAANAEYDAALTSTSKARRLRFRDIAEKAGVMLDAGKPIGATGVESFNPEVTARRCLKAAGVQKGGEA